MWPPHHRNILPGLFWTIHYFGLAIFSVTAQSPAIVSCMAYATVNKETFYTQGRTTDFILPMNTSVPQLYSLDLTQQTWSASNPPWRALKPFSVPSITAPTLQIGSTLSVDGQTLSLWITSPNGGIANYMIREDNWEAVIPSPPQMLSGGRGLQPVADPRTEIVYTPGMHYGSMSVYDFATGVSTAGASFMCPPKPLYYYSFAWNSQRSTMIFYGATSDTANPFFEFSPSTGKWELWWGCLLLAHSCQNFAGPSKLYTSEWN